MMPYMDLHCHLQTFAPEQLGEVLAKAREAGVKAFLLAAQDLGSAKAAIDVARTQEGLYAAVGLHPWMVEAAVMEKAELLWHQLEELTSYPQVVAFSEIGLDHVRCEPATWSYQDEALVAQWRLAAQVGLPVVGHNKGAYPEMLALWRSLPARERPPAMAIHGFSGTAADARDYLEEGFYLSFGKALLDPAEEQMREVAAGVPLDRLLVDTDSNNKPGRPVPLDVVDIASTLAQLQGVELDRVEEAMWASARRLLQKDL